MGQKASSPRICEYSYPEENKGKTGKCSDDCIRIDGKQSQYCELHLCNVREKNSARHCTNPVIFGAKCCQSHKCYENSCNNTKNLDKKVYDRNYNNNTNTLKYCKVHVCGVQSCQNFKLEDDIVCTLCHSIQKCCVDKCIERVEHGHGHGSGSPHCSNHKCSLCGDSVCNIGSKYCLSHNCRIPDCYKIVTKLGGNCHDHRKRLLK